MSTTFINVTTAVPDDVGGYTTFSKILIIIAGTILSILTAGGNLLVMLSFRIDKHLQIISNYFLFSLAVADLVIGLISCPFMTLYTVKNEWTLGYAACQFWLSVDYLMSNASVWNLLLISLDRYFSVTRPLTYRPKRTNKKALIMIASTYVLSLVLWPPWIIAWPYIEGQFVIPDNACMVQFLVTNAAVTIGTIMAAFYIPVTIMVILYARVFYATQKRQKELKTLQGFNRMSTKKSTDSGALARSTIRKGSVGSIIEESEESKPLRSPEMMGRASIMYQTRQAKRLLKNLRCRRCLGSKRRSLRRQRSTMEESDSVYSNSSLDLSMAPIGTPKISVSNTSSGPRSSAVAMRLAAQEKQMSALKDDPKTGFTRSSRRNLPKDFVLPRSASERHRSSDNVSVSETYEVVIQLPPDHEQNGKPNITILENQEPNNPRLLCTHNDETHRRLSVDSARNPVEHERLNQKHFSDLNVGSPQGSICSNQNFQGLISNPGAIKKHSINIHASLLKTHKKKAADRKRNVEKKQEMKAAKTLSAILLAFILTWAPYSIIICIEAVFPGTTPAVWFTFSYYLCYINSTINPILYALCNVNFRRTYMRILTCKWSNPRRNDNRNFSVFTKT